MDLFWALVGAVIGVPVGALLRPWAARLERGARAVQQDSPLLIHVERDPSMIWAGAPDWMPFSVYFPNVLRLPDPPAGRDEWLAWARRHGGVDASLTQLSVTLQAKVDAAVVIEGLKVRNDTRPVEQGIVLVRTTGGADLMPRQFRVDLDWESAAVVTFEDQGGNPANTPRMKIAAGDIERFHIWASAEQGWHDWTVELLLLVEGRRVVVPIDNEGAPFTTVGPHGLPRRMNYAGTTEVEVWPEDQ